MGNGALRPITLQIYKNITMNNIIQEMKNVYKLKDKFLKKSKL